MTAMISPIRSGPAYARIWKRRESQLTRMTGSLLGAPTPSKPSSTTGRARHLHSKGREVVFFDKKARARLENDRPAAAREAARLSRTYAVIGPDGTVITVGHRYRRLRRT